MESKTSTNPKIIFLIQKPPPIEDAGLEDPSLSLEEINEAFKIAASLTDSSRDGNEESVIDNERENDVNMGTATTPTIAIDEVDNGESMDSGFRNVSSVNDLNLNDDVRENGVGSEKEQLKH